MIFKNDEELQAKCEEWQKRLRLQDWIVKCKIVRQRDMTNETAAAEVKHYIKKKQAAIRMRDSIDYPDECITDQDMEWDLIHELLHLYLAPLHTDETDEVVEQIVECLASSFIALYREKQPQAKKELKAV
jgi:hypothetical protein